MSMLGNLKRVLKRLIARIIKPIAKFVEPEVLENPVVVIKEKIAAEAKKPTTRKPRKPAAKKPVAKKPTIKNTDA